MEFLTAGQNLPFTVALGLMFGIALMEGVGLLLGVGLSSLIDEILPEFDFDVDVDADLDMDVDADIDVDVDADIDIDADSDLAHVSTDIGLTRILGWLRVGKVPILVLLVIFLTSFGLAGLIFQSLVHGTSGVLLPGLLASLLAAAVAFPSVRIFGGVIARIIPKDETSAVSEDSLVGRVATVMRGTAKKGTPAEARLKDQHGQRHYILVEPDEDNEEFTQGTSVVLVKRDGAVFQAIKSAGTALGN